MKNKTVLLGLVLSLVAAGSYFYYQRSDSSLPHQTPDYALDKATLSKAYQANDSLAEQKYVNRIIEYTGQVTRVIPQSHSIDVDDNMVAIFLDSIIPKEVQAQKKVTLKGRYLGYDSMMDEYQMDQVSLTEIHQR